jgi:hypothetical protein
MLLCYDNDVFLYCTVNLDEVQLMKLILAPEGISGLSETVIWNFLYVMLMMLLIALHLQIKIQITLIFTITF